MYIYMYIHTYIYICIYIYTYMYIYMMIGTCTDGITGKENNVADVFQNRMSRDQRFKKNDEDKQGNIYRHIHTSMCI
jgi:hypothetical protein